MTTDSIAVQHPLAQQAFEFISNRLPDNVGLMWELLKSLNLDHEIYLKLENEVAAAINDSEQHAFLMGFTFGRALDNVPGFAGD